VSAERAKGLISGAQLKVIKEAPHGLVVTHHSEFNSILLNFLKAE